MPEKLSARVERLENLVGVLAEKQGKLDDVLVLLTEAQIKTEERFQEVGQRFQETNQRIDNLAVSLEAERVESAARGRALDERLEKLVSAIGEMLRTRNGKH
jgi:hypothetical protein